MRSVAMGKGSIHLFSYLCSRITRLTLAANEPHKSHIRFRQRKKLTPSNAHYKRDSSIVNLRSYIQSPFRLYAAKALHDWLFGAAD